MGPHARARAWVPVTLTEMKAFLAVMFNMGLMVKPRIADYWTTAASQATPWFSRVFSRNRFQLILRYFHVTNSKKILPTNHPDYDPTARFRPVTTHANMTFQRHYTPRQMVTGDESLVGTKTRTELIQYIPNKKHAQWGIKLWQLAEALTGYILRFIIYRGKRLDPVPRGQTQGTQVVMDLMSGANLLDKNYHVVTDNFFTSQELARSLEQRNTFLTGTVRKNRPLPQMVKNAEVEPGQAFYAREGTKLACHYKQTENRKSTLLLSTAAKAGQGDSGKPEVVELYNKNKGGVDLSDQMLYSYMDERKTVKYWKKVVFNVFQKMLLNAYIIYRQHTQDEKKMTRQRFVQKVVEELAAEQIAARPANPIQAVPRVNRPQQQVRIRNIPAGRERECCVCSRRPPGGQRRRSRTQCVDCRRGLHPTCLLRHQCVREA